METIRNYLDNLFANLPKNAEISKLKNDILSTMEEKYYEHKNLGKTENEAIGIVISEFGNIDELIDELGIEHVEGQEVLPVVSPEAAWDYLYLKKAMGNLIGIGVFLCILGPAMLVLITQLLGDGLIGQRMSANFKDMFGIMMMFLFIGPGVGIIIYAALQLEPYGYLKGDFLLPDQVRLEVEQRARAFSSSFATSLIVGVCLCVLSPMAIFIVSAFFENASSYGVFAFLLIVAFAVYIFIYNGNIKESYSMLLQVNSFSQNNKKVNRVIGAVASVVWPLATCIFFIRGLVYGQWHIDWVIFPITGILFGMFIAVYNIMKGDELS